MRFVRQPIFLGSLALYLIANSILAFGGVGISHAVELQPLLLSGEPAPGVESSIFSNVVVGSASYDRDMFSFSSGLSAPDNERPVSSLWAWEDGRPSLVARLGDPAPGGPDGSVLSERLGRANAEAGRIGAVTAGISGTQVRGRLGYGIWRPNDGMLDPVVRTGVPLSGQGLDHLAAYGFPSLATNRQKEIALGLALYEIDDGDVFGGGVFRQQSQGNLNAVALTGQAVPGATEDLIYWNSFGNFSLDDENRLVFVSQLLNSSGMGLRHAILSQAEGENVEVIALEGRQAPGLANGVLFGDFSRPANPAAAMVHSENGRHLAFQSYLIGPDVDDSNGRAIWFSNNDSAPMLVARHGDIPVGYDQDQRFAWFNALTVNDQAIVSFQAGTTTDQGTYSVSLWKTLSDENLQEIARSGQTAPGTDLSFDSFQSNYVNGRGQSVFKGFLVGDGVDETNNLGIWAEDLNGRLHFITRMGDEINISNDPFNSDLRVVQSLRLGESITMERCSSVPISPTAVRVFFDLHQFLNHLLRS